jgi:hypothetical protein
MAGMPSPPHPRPLSPVSRGRGGISGQRWVVGQLQAGGLTRSREGSRKGQRAVGGGRTEYEYEGALGRMRATGAG